MISPLPWLLQNAVIATTGALLLALALRHWRPPARLEHLLWLLLALKFTLPPLVVVPVVISSAPGATTVRTILVAPNAPERREQAGPGLSQPPPGSSLALQAASPYAGQRPDAPASWIHLLGWVWMVGTVATLAWRIATALFWRRNRRPQPAPDDLVATVAMVARDMGVRAPPTRVDTGLTVPVVAGLFRPTLLWPGVLVGALPPDRVRTIVAHELAHLRRGDLWVHGFELFAGAVWWWYPGWYMVRRRLRDASERACDAVVTVLYPSLRRSYADALLDVAAAAPLRHAGFAAGLNGRAVIGRRLRAILDPELQRRSRGGPIAVALVLGLVLPAWRAAPAAPISEPLAPPPAAVSRPMQGAAEHQPPVDTTNTIMAALTRAAEDPEPPVRRTAANALRDLSDPDARLVLRSLAEDEDGDVRHSARSALGLEPARPNLVLAGRQTTETWQGNLDSLHRVALDAHSPERLEAVRRLGNLRDESSIPVLIRALSDPTFQVRQSAADALGNIGHPAAATPLARLLSDGHPRVRQSAASALGRTGNGSHATILARALADADVHVRQNVTAALGLLGRRSEPR